MCTSSPVPAATEHEVTGAVLAAAATQARAAASAAGVRIERVEDPQGLRAVAELLARVWATTPVHGPLPPDVLRTVTHAGGAVHVAHGVAGLVGATAALFEPPGRRRAYSLIAAADASNRGVGFALKQAQRAWALEHEATEMVWTFDPLVSRNARFNLVKLGAVAREYIVDFYGPLDDGVNGRDETDRLTALWSLTALENAGAPQDRDRGIVAPVWTAPDGNHRGGEAPDRGPLVVADRQGLWCRVPLDIVAVRQRDPDLAAAWRTAVRDVFVSAIADGLHATGMTRDGWYRLTREGPR